VVAHEYQGALLSGQPGTSEAGRKQEQRAGHLGRIGEPVHLTVGEDVPDCHQELPGYCHYRLRLAQVGLALLEEFHRVQLLADGLVSMIHHRTTQVTYAGIDDTPGGTGHSAVMHLDVPPKNWSNRSVAKYESPFL
jgi:hypothetical protein